MAQQQFTDTFRECLWKEHGQRCFYCEKPVKFVDFEVDHLIPEYLTNRPKKFAAVQIEYGLDSKFNIKGHENLAPACASCNAKKGDILLPVGQVAILLARIASRLEAIAKCTARKQQDRSLGYILLAIGKAIDNKIFSKDDLFAALKKKGYIEFIGSSSLAISSEDIATTKQEPSTALEDKPIIFSKNAQDSMLARKITMLDIVFALQSGVVVESVSLHQDGSSHPTYKVRALDREGDQIEIIFSIEGDTIIILTCY